MSPPSSLIKVPPRYLWNVAVTVAAKEQFKFSPRCEANFKERLKAGLAVYKVGLYEFRERITEAETNIEKLVRLMISEEAASDPTSRILHEQSLFSALYTGKLCPGLWPIC